MSPDLPSPGEVRLALLRERLRLRQIDAARTRLADAVDTFNATQHATAAERLLAIHELNQLRLALSIAEGRPQPYSIGRYVCRK